MSGQWTTLKLLDWTKQYFATKGVENPRLDAEVLLCDVLHCSRINLYVNFEQPLEEAELAQYRSYVQRRGQLEPLAYILGHREFMAYDFKVTEATLIPRPETELLVEQIVKLNQAKGAVRLLDIGCGSGAIILSLLKMLPQASGVASDISSEALAVTKENAATLGVTERVELVQSDVFAAVPLVEPFDVIVSNPPYIPTADIATLAADVQKEPHGALDGGRLGLDIYTQILAGIKPYLQEEGMLALEIGINQAEAVVQLCREADLTVVKVRQDYAGIARMVFATKEGSKYANEIMALKEEQ